LNSTLLRRWVTTALFTALVTIGTMIIQIPTPATEGFINFGDAFVFLTGALMGPIPGMLAGGIGSALADALSGYTHYAPWTLAIKGLEGLLVGLIVYRNWHSQSKLAMPIIGMTLAGAWMILGYFISGSFMYGWKVALTSIPSNAIQAVGSVIITIPLLIPLRTALNNSRKNQ
jgi:uncharacterized membrane protein